MPSGRASRPMTQVLGWPITTRPAPVRASKILSISADECQASLMRADDVNQLVGLLNQLQHEGLVSPSLPREVWRALATLTPQVAVELLLTGSGKDVLLVFRDDEDWHGWHVPGGWVRCGELITQAVERIGAHELRTRVIVEGIVGSFAWPDHPYAQALSLLCACRFVGTVPSVPGGQFFSTLPSPMVPHHGAFAHRYLTAMKSAGPLGWEKEV